MFSAFNLSSYITINKTNFTITLSNGSVFLFKGLDDKEKIKSIVGITDIWAEECSEFVDEDITQLDLRLRAKVDNLQFYFSFNPISKANWTYKKWFAVNSVIDENTLVIGVSQSGETADTLTAIKQSKTKGSHVLIITNRPDSAMAREADSLISVCAGIEVSVAATKSYMAQLVSFYMLALYMAEIKGSMDKNLLINLKKELIKLPEKAEEILAQESQVKLCARKYANAKNFVYIARGINYATALEGALKLKEISYINATGYPAGELKHGPIAMLDETLPVLSIMMKGKVFEKILSNSEEAKARNARMIALTNSTDEKLEELFDDILRVPDTDEYLSPILAIIPLQLLAYYIAEFLGKDVDQPRNLAKSVTVE